MNATTRRITVVAHELRGFHPVGGMGTATTYLALALARMGHSVEFLLGIHDPRSIDPYWESVYKRAGIRLRPVPANDEPVEPWEFVHSHKVQLGLQAEPADVVIAHDFGGPAYSALRLRQAGVAFEHTLFVIFCHGTRQYLMDLAPTARIPDLRDLLAVTIHERAAIELADVVVSPSTFLVDWMRSVGWRLPERKFVIPHFTQSSASGETVSKRSWEPRELLRRLTFFGRLDERKGIAVFAEGMNALEPALLEGIELEFVGKTTETWPRERVEALLSAATRRALRSVHFETELDQLHALARVSEAGTVAIMPSLQENSPNAVYECLERGIPFLASEVGGVPELITPEDRSRVLFEPTAIEMKKALLHVLAERRVPRPARAAYAVDTPYELWRDVTALRPVPLRRSAERTSVDVIVVRRTESDAAARCAAELEGQSYANVRVQIAEGATIDAARAAAVQRTSAPFLLFLDEDDVPDAALVATLVEAQQASDADVVTCGLRLEEPEGHALHFFSGEPGGLGALANAYGNVGLFRRGVLGDLTTARASEGDPDWPLLARLAAAGARIISIPAPLVTRSRAPGSVERDPGDALPVLEQLESALPDSMRSTARLAAGLAADQPPTPAPSGIARRALRRLLPGGR